MALAAKRRCKRCGAVVRGRCNECARPQQPQRDRRASSAQRGYGYRWQKARAYFLQANPLCVECEREGRCEPATEVDHIVPHRGDTRLFWDAANWQGLCKRHHSQKTASGR